MSEYTDGDDEVAIPHPYTAEDIARGYTTSNGSQDREVRRAIPIDVLRLIEARRLNAILTRLAEHYY